MAFWNNRKQPETDIDTALRQWNDARREQQRVEQNDRRAEQGQARLHCGVPVTTNSLGDALCSRCGEVGFF